MRILKKLAKMFSNDICIEEKNITGIVFPYELKGGEIKIDSKVVVPKSYSFIIGHNGKALDMFNEGTHILCPATLPECCKKLKIHKADKKGNFVKKFKADAYFIKQESYSMQWKTYGKAELGKKASGIFKVSAFGDITFSVLENRKLMENLLSEFAYLKKGEADYLIKNWISDSVIKTFEKFNFALSEFIQTNEIIYKETNAELGSCLSKLGIKLDSFEITQFVLPKRYQKQYEAFNNKNNYTNNKKETYSDNHNSEEENKDIQNLNKESECSNETKIKEKSFNYEPFGDFIIEDKAEIVNLDYKSTQEQFDSDTCDQEEEFINLDLNAIEETQEHSVRCIRCGTKNTTKDVICVTCGEIL